MIAHGTINRDAMIHQLDEAHAAIDDLIDRIRSGDLDDAESHVLGIFFSEILGHVCLAWHRKWMSDEDIESLSQEEFELMMHSIPQWGIEHQLVDIAEPRRFDLRRAKD